MPNTSSRADHTAALRQVAVHRHKSCPKEAPVSATKGTIKVLLNADASKTYAARGKPI